MYRRMLFVGLGGSGGKTLRCLKRDLKQWLIDHNWDGPFPKGWQFVHIDIPPVPDGLRPGGGTLDPTEYLGLVGESTQFSVVANVVSSIPRIDEELFGWRVDPAAVQVPLTMGAGQFRAIGRTVAMAYAAPIRERLRSSIATLNDPGAAAELNALYAQSTDGEAPSTAPVAPIAVVVSSLAGGTGAGLLIDVCDTLRALEPGWGSESIALLYTPEVFLGLGDAAVGGVQPNSLAAISEVLNGYWWHGGTEDSNVPLKEPAALSNAGIGNAIRQSGPFCPYLIGSTGANGVQFQSDTQLFETVGGALVSWATDPQVQQNFVAHSIGNWQNSAAMNQVRQDVLVNQGQVPGEPGLPAFSALGFSRVSLGTKHLKEYASRRLARDAAEHLAKAHLTSAEAQSLVQHRKMVDPEQLTDELASRYLPWFISTAQLDERGPDKNDIKDAIKPVDWWTQFDNAVSWAMSLVDDRNVATPSVWIQSLEPAVEQSTAAFQAAVEPAIQHRLQQWIKTHPSLVLRTTEEAIARFGLRVTGRILLKVAEYLDHPTDGVVAELRGDTEMGNYLRYAQPAEWKRQLRVYLDEGSKSKIQRDHPGIQDSVSEAMKYSTCIAQATVCEKISDLLVDFAQGFVRPLAYAVNDAGTALESSLPLISDWPVWAPGPPPLDLTPPKSEWTLIEPDEFHDVFTELLAATFSSESRVGPDEQQRLARDQIVSGSFIRDLMETAPAAAEPLLGRLLLSQSATWRPDFRVSHLPEPPSPAAFEVRTKPEEIASRADAWMSQRGTPFEILFSSTLRTFTAHEPGGIISASPAEYTRRQQRFLQKLQSAISSAAPLVGINPSLIGLLHPQSANGGSIKITRDVTQIPFLNHPLDGQIRTELEKAVYSGARRNRVESVMVNDTHLPHIDIISQLDAPVSPLVVESLMKPIADSWAMNRPDERNPARRNAFWSLRRARVLREFIPVPQEHLRAMVRGWFTAQLLGLIDVSSQPYSIVRDPLADLPNERAAFPAQFLSTSGEDKDRLPLVLESLPLAYVEVGNQGSLAPLNAYIALRDYGRSSPAQNPEVLGYTQLHPVFRHWLDHGSIPNEAAIIGYRGVRPEIEAASREERQRRTDDFLSLISSDYQSMWSAYLPQVAASRKKMSSAPFWPELHSDIQAALSDLQLAMKSIGGAGQVNL